MRTLIGLVIALCGWVMGLFFAAISLAAMGGGILRMDAKLFFDGAGTLLVGFVTWWILVVMASPYGIPRPRLVRKRKQR